MDAYLEWRKQLSQIDLNALNDEQRREMVDLHIGLNLLGDEGTRQLYEYLLVSRQREK